MSWIVIATLVLSLLAGGGAGVVYAADGSSPGDPLYGLDTAIESLRLAVTPDPQARTELALEFAQERLLELQELAAEGGSEDGVQQAADGYGENVRQAAEALAAAAASGDDQAGVESLKALLQQALTLNTRVLSEVYSQVPEQAQAAIERAIDASEAGKTAIDELFSEGTPGGPEGPSDGAPQGVPGGQPDGTPGGGPGDRLEGTPEGEAQGTPGAGPKATPNSGTPGSQPQGPPASKPESAPSGSASDHAPNSAPTGQP
jgi:hypothetical protein